jgi:hypothetical protein
MSAECRYIVVKLKWWCGGFFRGESCTLGNPLQQSGGGSDTAPFQGYTGSVLWFQAFSLNWFIINKETSITAPITRNSTMLFFLVEYLRASIAP